MNWIDTSQELPDDEQTVLICTDDGEVWTGYHESDQWVYVSGNAIEPEVTHWMEFPDAPNAEIMGCEAVPLDIEEIRQSPRAFVDLETVIALSDRVMVLEMEVENLKRMADEIEAGE